VCWSARGPAAPQLVFPSRERPTSWWIRRRKPACCTTLARMRATTCSRSLGSSNAFALLGEKVGTSRTRKELP
jgi:hypothetical protein